MRVRASTPPSRAATRGSTTAFAQPSRSSKGASCVGSSASYNPPGPPSRMAALCSRGHGEQARLTGAAAPDPSVPRTCERPASGSAPARGECSLFYARVRHVCSNDIRSKHSGAQILTTATPTESVYRGDHPPAAVPTSNDRALRRRNLHPTVPGRAFCEGTKVGCTKLNTMSKTAASQSRTQQGVRPEGRAHDQIHVS
jgi:hypothetical protein